MVVAPSYAACGANSCKLSMRLMHENSAYADQSAPFGERTRDKMRAARQKGKWIGGVPVLGYDVAAEGGRLVGHISRARVSQMMNLLSLAPEIQEYLLWLPCRRGNQITERHVRQIAKEIRWDRQRTLFWQYARAELA